MTEDAHEPEASDFVEQLQADDTLIDRGLADALDEGVVTHENWSPLMGYGNTPAEMKRRETIEQRMLQDEVEVVRDDGPWNPDGEDRQVGGRRAGRIVYLPDVTGEVFGMDVGIDGGAASAEEAAMHIIEPEDDDDR